MFVGDAIDFCYTKDMCFAKLKDGFERCKIGKVAYIPAERNAVTLPNIASLKMPEYNTRSFIFDWLEVHQKFQKKNAVDLLKLKLKYRIGGGFQRVAVGCAVVCLCILFNPLDI